MQTSTGPDLSGYDLNQRKCYENIKIINGRCFFKNPKKSKFISNGALIQIWLCGLKIVGFKDVFLTVFFHDICYS